MSGEVERFTQDFTTVVRSLSAEQIRQLALVVANELLARYWPGARAFREAALILERWIETQRLVETTRTAERDARDAELRRGG